MRCVLSGAAVLLRTRCSGVCGDVGACCALLYTGPRQPFAPLLRASAHTSCVRQPFMLKQSIACRRHQPPPAACPQVAGWLAALLVR